MGGCAVLTPLGDFVDKTAATNTAETAIRRGGAVRLLFVLTTEVRQVRGSALATIRIAIDALTAASLSVGDDAVW